MDLQPLPADRDTLYRSLSETELESDVVARLAAQARPAVLLLTEAAAEDELPPGISKIGGRPDLPRNAAWPTRPPYADASRRAERNRKRADRLLADSRKPRSWMSPEQAEGYARELRARAEAAATEFPLAFFGQFDLSHLAREGGFDTSFPAEGRLLLFYDCWQQPEEFVPEAAIGWRLIWDRTPAADLARAPVPAALQHLADEEWSRLFRPTRVSTRSVITPIPPNDKSWDAFSLDDDEALDEYQDWLSQFGTPDREGRDNHQFGGFPQTLQNGLQARSQLAANGLYCGGGDVWETAEARELLKSAKDWRLVLQIGVDPHAGIPQPGAYYVIMREQDIAARRFDRARVTYQCD